MQHERDACVLAEKLMAVTLAAHASIRDDDWQTAGQLLRRRDQLLTQLEACENLAEAQGALEQVQSVEESLFQLIDKKACEAFAEVARNHQVRSAAIAYAGERRKYGHIEDIG